MFFVRQDVAAWILLIINQKCIQDESIYQKVLKWRGLLPFCPLTFK